MPVLMLPIGSIYAESILYLTELKGEYSLEQYTQVFVDPKSSLQFEDIRDGNYSSELEPLSLEKKQLLIFPGNLLVSVED